MLKTLIKKQLLELNKSFFVDRKTGKGKSHRSATFSIVLFILLMIFAIGGMFCYMSYSMRPLITYGMSWLYFAIMGATAALFGVSPLSGVLSEDRGGVFRRFRQRVQHIFEPL